MSDREKIVEAFTTGLNSLGQHSATEKLKRAARLSDVQVPNCTAHEMREKYGRELLANQRVLSELELSQRLGRRA